MPIAFPIFTIISGAGLLWSGLHGYYPDNVPPIWQVVVGGTALAWVLPYLIYRALTMKGLL